METRRKNAADQPVSGKDNAMSMHRKAAIMAAALALQMSPDDATAFYRKCSPDQPLDDKANQPKRAKVKAARKARRKKRK